MINNLESSKAIEILLSLYPDKTLMLSDIRKKIGSSSMVATRIAELINMKLINENYEAKYGGRRLINLTDKGKKITKHLVEIQKILEEK
jgi:DNA-binding HxlR family transcriptional regulator